MTVYAFATGGNSVVKFNGDPATTWIYKLNSAVYSDSRQHLLHVVTLDSIFILMLPHVITALAM